MLIKRWSISKRSSLKEGRNRSIRVCGEPLPKLCELYTYMYQSVCLYLWNVYTCLKTETFLLQQLLQHVVCICICMYVRMHVGLLTSSQNFVFK